MRMVLGAIALVLVAAVAVTLLRPQITRADLAIKPASERQCVRTALPTYKRKLGEYNRRVAANDYMPYAIATLNVYREGQRGRFKTFTLAAHSPRWKKVRSVKDRDGLGLDIYHAQTADQLTQLAVFRGTETLDSADWLANLSWLTAWLPIETQYDIARRIYKRERRKAYQAAGDRKVSFITAGHSLGGGLAQHVAYAFPCVSAAVFNASFVTNKFRLAEPYSDAPIVHIFEDNDELTRLRRLIFADKETRTYKHYRQNAVRNDRDFQHSMTQLVAGMARQVIRCQTKRDDCRVPADDLRTRQAFCGSIGAKRPICKSNGGS
ncbi:MAG: hypothetical protein AAFR04_00420 [Pseudomonadota bacterium]